MRISLFGLGYVGCVSGACLACAGHQVIGVDVTESKVRQIEDARSPVAEPGLDELVRDVVMSGALCGTLDPEEAVIGSDISIICVGTPSNGNGSLDLRYVESVCRDIGRALHHKQSYHVVVVRSTVLPGTVEDCIIPLLETVSGKRVGVDFGVCANPEFLRESSAIADYRNPGYIIIGESDPQSGDLVEEMYAGIDAEVIRTAIPVAEMVKYVNNAFHALKVTFANEIGNICKLHDIDGTAVMEIMCRDKRLNISPAYLKPGFAFGGSCLPKDLRALLYRARARDLETPLLRATLVSNQQQIQRGIELVERAGHKRVGVLGLSFKAGTDDVRESSAVPLLETLVGRGYQVRIYDETVELPNLIGTNKTFLERELPHIATLMSPSVEQVVHESDVIVIANDSAVFREVPNLITENQIVIDLVGVAKNHGESRGVYEGICW
jgi:GDP-mannose 6-dehydrogenase